MTRNGTKTGGKIKGTRNWTKEELNFLDENWGKLSIPAIGRRLGRTINAVKCAATRIGLTRWLHNGEFITLNQLINALGMVGGYTFRKELFIRNGLPVHRRRAIRRSYAVVYLNEFWKWAEVHKGSIDLSRVDPLSLGEEPAWAAEKRKADQMQPINKGRDWTPKEDGLLKEMLRTQRYGYAEISRSLQRTEGAIKRRICTLGIRERPVPAEDLPWMDDETAKLLGMLHAGYTFELIGKAINRSALACRGKYERILNPEAMKRYWRRKQEELRKGSLCASV